MMDKQIAKAEFIENLKNSIDMSDRKFAVEVLAKAVGADEANYIAEQFGLRMSYYKVSK